MATKPASRTSPQEQNILHGAPASEKNKQTSSLGPEESSKAKMVASSEQKGSVESLVSKMSINSTSAELVESTNEAKSECSLDQEKKKSDQGGVKGSSISAKVNDRTDLVESGKSSICRGSTSSDISDESSCSSFTSGINKPHKVNDLRWEAIQLVRARDGILGLSHFRLLKRLGCGDIGSVYLSELSGTKCYFAMKVMDKASLASRKKLLRAQTEREILQCLDHPFLPSLYTHFETDKFSCLVMEFCPGGDLHTLRQRQPGKYFPEQAVKYGFLAFSEAWYSFIDTILVIFYSDHVHEMKI
ncbi:hypothetical protein SAY86_025796 [Trapa natans]|uniref:non-specific serine/threonine protein kinase n=1 Tax=Trapa natans TaxID=22666 RepID=A0AAN7KIN1_TRANT|nr:hypothetical protein SAY86_025796 [Trapa natans]